MNLRLCIALHDVAPAYQHECAILLAMLECLGSPPVTLLVVPDFHGKGPVSLAPAVRRLVDQWLAKGAEVALHGFTHRDDLTQGHGVAAWVGRRLLTDGEGEFSILDEAEALNRIERGLDLLHQCGWQPQGFVPPAWLASRGARQAVAKSGLRYTSTHTRLISLPTPRSIFAPCITASARTPGRRIASMMFMQASPHFMKAASTIRIGLHPMDARHPRLLERWRVLLEDVLSVRDAVTKSQAVHTLR